MNLGAAKLAVRFKERGAQLALSRATGIDQGYLSRLARGLKTPGASTRRVLEDHCGIVMQCWDLEATPEVLALLEAPREPTEGETPDPEAA